MSKSIAVQNAATQAVNTLPTSVRGVGTSIVEGAKWFGRGVTAFAGKVVDYAANAASTTKTFFTETAGPAVSQLGSTTKKWALANPELLKGMVAGAIIAGVFSAIIANVRGNSCQQKTG